MGKRHIDLGDGEVGTVELISRDEWLEKCYPEKVKRIVQLEAENQALLRVVRVAEKIHDEWYYPDDLNTPELAALHEALEALPEHLRDNDG